MGELKPRQRSRTPAPPGTRPRARSDADPQPRVRGRPSRAAGLDRCPRPRSGTGQAVPRPADRDREARPALAGAPGDDADRHRPLRREPTWFVLHGLLVQRRLEQAILLAPGRHPELAAQEPLELRPVLNRAARGPGARPPGRRRWHEQLDELGERREPRPATHCGPAASTRRNGRRRRSSGPRWRAAARPPPRRTNGPMASMSKPTCAISATSAANGVAAFGRQCPPTTRMFAMADVAASSRSASSIRRDWSTATRNRPWRESRGHRRRTGPRPRRCRATPPGRDERQQRVQRRTVGPRRVARKSPLTGEEVLPRRAPCGAGRPARDWLDACGPCGLQHADQVPGRVDVRVRTATQPPVRARGAPRTGRARGRRSPHPAARNPRTGPGTGSGPDPRRRPARRWARGGSARPSASG